MGFEPVAIAITPKGKTAYVANSGSGTVTPISIATNTAGPPIPVGSVPGAIAIATLRPAHRHPHQCWPHWVWCGPPGR